MTQFRGSQKTSAKEFEIVAKYAYESVGLVLGAGKLAMLRSRLRHRLEFLEIATVADYFQYAQDVNSREEHRHIVAALTTNVSSFFREKHHFDVLNSLVWPEVTRAQKHGASTRVWSAGCSHGQEPFSIAMSLIDYFPKCAGEAVKIIATDVDQMALQKATKAEFDAASLKDLPIDLLKRHFEVVEASGANTVRARSAMRDRVEFRYSNLIKDRSAAQRYDVIFCRNVMIYFDKPTQRTVLANLVKALRKGGYLFIGHAERAEHKQLKALGGTVYRRES